MRSVPSLEGFKNSLDVGEDRVCVKLVSQLIFAFQLKDRPGDTWRSLPALNSRPVKQDKNEASSFGLKENLVFSLCGFQLTQAVQRFLAQLTGVSRAGTAVT